MKRLRGVIIGCGYFSPFHLDAWNRIDSVDLVAVADVDAQRAVRCAQEYGVPESFTDYREMLDKVQPDFVDIVTRPDTHLEIVSEVAGRRIAMICQKPLAPDTATARRLVATAAGAGARLMVHENFRFQPWYREIKRLYDRGVVGDTLHTMTFRNRAGDGHGDDAYLKRQPYFQTMPRFLVFEAGIHTIDTFRFLGGEMSRVMCLHRRLNPVIAGEDTAIAMFEFSSGGLGLYDANRFNESTAKNPRYTFGEFWLEANGGTIRFDDEGAIFIQRIGQAEVRHDFAPSKHGFAGDCVHATQEHFAQSLQNEQPFETDGEDYLKNLRVQDAMYESSEKRTWITLGSV